jgi:hypothetical protein
LVREGPIYKLLILGESSVGKSTLIYRYVYPDIFEDVPTTIGIDFFTKQMKIGEMNVKVSLPSSLPPPLYPYLKRVAPFMGYRRPRKICSRDKKLL